MHIIEHPNSFLLLSSSISSSHHEQSPFSLQEDDEAPEQCRILGPETIVIAFDYLKYSLDTVRYLLRSRVYEI